MTTPEHPPNGLAPSEPVRLEDLVQVAPGSVVSRTLARTAGGTLTLFAFAAGQGLSEHSAPFDAFVQVLSGVGEMTIGGRTVRARAGETVLMPANVPHAVHAPGDFKMLLTMLRMKVPAGNG